MIAALHRISRWAGVDLHKYYAAYANSSRLLKRPFDHLPLRGVGAEIGVYRGFHARDMLRSHPAITTLYCIDGYTSYGRECPLLQEAKVDASKLLRKFGSRVQFIYQASPEGVGQLPALDFCYIDGDHGYTAVTNDIAATWPKIKPGGLLGGHDFFDAFPELIEAVTEFTVLNNLQLNVWTPDWWVIKPNTQ